MFADTLERQSHDFRQVGVAYVRFALENPAHFTVMFRPDLYRVNDPAVVAGRAPPPARRGAGARTRPPHPRTAGGGGGAAPRARAVLSEGARTLTPDTASGESDRAVALMAWSCAHGFAHLWLSGAFPENIGNDPEQAAHAVFGAMFGGAGLGG
ncbi:TetR-like C-terminal domain-containing protein [Saccharomonospora xinjiangensis]